jgi:hypothetical protein
MPMINLELTKEELTLITRSLYWAEWVGYDDEMADKVETLYLKLREISNRKVGD